MDEIEKVYHLRNDSQVFFRQICDVCVVLQILNVTEMPMKLSCDDQDVKKDYNLSLAGNPICLLILQHQRIKA